MNPVIPYVGGKRRLSGFLLENMPGEYSHYYEPFVGAGALFLSCNPKQATISDTNIYLITMYEAIQQNPAGLLVELCRLSRVWKPRMHSTPLRREALGIFVKDINKLVINGEIVEKERAAALFIYISKLSFHSMVTVVGASLSTRPYCKDNIGAINIDDAIMECAKHLQGVGIHRKAYNEIKPACGDFVYLDPPYDGSLNADFYGGDIDQEQIADFVRELDSRGVFVMISNIDNERVRELYKGFSIIDIIAPRSWGTLTKSFSTKAKELLILNYKPNPVQPMFL